MPNTIKNERLKIEATFFNNSAVATVTAGALTPLVGKTVGIAGFSTVPEAQLALLVVFLILVAHIYCV